MKQLSYQDKLAKKKAGDERARAKYLAKPRKPLQARRKPVAKSKKRKPRNELKKAKDTLWSLVRQYVFKKYGTNCYTCGAKDLQGSNRQCGHMWPKAVLSNHLKYDHRVLRTQDYRCNINFGGNGAVFYSQMLKEIGPEAMFELEKERMISVKADLPFFEKENARYTQLLDELS
jgi:hypothetical protein